MSERWAGAKAIETVYENHRFRSRLEARWAVFFDVLPVAWEYEPEGFELDGIRYLPDFWLPRQKCWFEVKPEDPSEREIKKAERLRDHTGFPVVIGIGVPGDNPSLAFITDVGDSSGGSSCWEGIRWYYCERCHNWDQSYGDDSHTIVHAKTWDPIKLCHCDEIHRNFAQSRIAIAEKFAHRERFDGRER